MAHIACWLDWREGRREAVRSSVLVVDDDEAARYTTRRVLEHAEFAVTEAPNGQAALEAVMKRPDLVLLDLQLPDVDGFEVCRRIKSDPLTASMRVLPYTAVFKDEIDRRRALDAGADAYLIKPLSAEQLVATIHGLIGVE
jgi:DNA-binding response OmpR family regulator